MGRKSRDKDRKPRTEYIYARTSGEVSEVRFTVDQRTGAISFGPGMTNVYSERSYERPKGAKVLSRIPQTAAHATFDDGDALLAHYDRVFAIDTNTRTVQGRRLSIVDVATLKREVTLGPTKIETGWRFDAPFALEYGELTEKPEPFGWMSALSILKARGYYADGMRVGVIVDSELGQLKAFNERTTPVDQGEFLPPKVTLLYASSDAGKENLLNQALAIADTVSSQIFGRLAAGDLPMSVRPTGVPQFTTYREIEVNAIDGTLAPRPADKKA